MTRKYSVAEIDQMREVLRWNLTPLNCAYHQDELEERVERQLRTYMEAGIDPAELVIRHR